MTRVVAFHPDQGNQQQTMHVLELRSLWVSKATLAGFLRHFHAKAADPGVWTVNLFSAVAVLLDVRFHTADPLDRIRCFIGRTSTGIQGVPDAYLATRGGCLSK